MPPTSPLLERLPTRIAAATVGPHRYLTLPHLIRLFQEAALRNTDRLAISSGQLTDEHGLTWVLHRQLIEADAWPAIGEAVVVTTLPTSIDRRLITYRDFYLTRPDGHPLIRSTSAWSLMDVHSRRIRPIPDAVRARLGELPAATDHLPRPGDKPEPAAADAPARRFTVDFHHLDFNNHLTNPAFPELMLEPLGGEFLSTHLPRRADIAYQREARYGDALLARAAPAGPDAYTHALQREDGNQLATMRTEWHSLL